MKKSISFCVMSLTVAMVCAAPTISVLKANRVNVRSRPMRDAEVILQLNKGDEVKVLETKSVVEGAKTQQWSRILLPPQAKCYVLSKFIADGKATGDAVNIRCGPGTNFKEVGKLAKGEKVTVVKSAGEWTQIQPTPNCSGWIASEYLEAAPLKAPVITPALTPAPPAPAKPVEVVTAPVAAPKVESPPPAPPPAPVAPLAPVTPPKIEPETLEYFVVRDGIFQTVVPEELRGETPLAAHQLMTPMVERSQYRIAYLEMKLKDLDKYEGKHVRVLGNLRWRRGDRYPVIAVERIEMVW